MSEAHPLFDVLCKSADADCATALERLVREAPDRRLNRINVLDFARRQGLNEQRVITAFLHATQIGLLDMSWRWHAGQTRSREVPMTNAATNAGACSGGLQGCGGQHPFSEKAAVGWRPTMSYFCGYFRDLSPLF